MGVVDAYKTNLESRKYNELRNKAEDEEKKFVSAVAEKQASGYVSEYRKVRNWIESYVDVCSKAIGSLQSKLKYLAKETLHNK